MLDRLVNVSSLAVELKNVHKHYHGIPPVEALYDVSLSVGHGDFIGIVGASGSGKSTLLHVIGTLTRPSSGLVFVNGQDTSEMSDAEVSFLRSRNVGFIFQDFFLLPGFSARENVENGLIYSGITHSIRARKAKEILERVGLSHRINHLPNELSGGEQQRVAIARALIHSPSFVLADEPTGNLDSIASDSIMELLSSLNIEGTTVILITHDMGIADMCSRRIELKDGRVLFDTTETEKESSE